jgi:hypothetical protein
VSDNIILGKKLARAVFSLGDESKERGGKCQRLQFKCGTWPDGEVDGGGMDEKALASLLARVFTQILERP